MKKSILAMLNDSEQALLRETEARELEGLDEDDLLDLHTRVRRARTKYSKLYRRRASAQVGKDARRSGAHPKHARTAVKAEIFEDALARVSRQLARAAKESAALLKAERLAAAREGKGRRTITGSLSRQCLALGLKLAGGAPATAATGAAVTPPPGP